MQRSFMASPWREVDRYVHITLHQSRRYSPSCPGFAPETATFIAECAEDDNDNIVREVHRLKNAVESIAGRIDV